MVVLRSSQWALVCAVVVALFGGLTVAYKVSVGAWAPSFALPGFGLTCGGWAAVAVLVAEVVEARHAREGRRVVGIDRL